MLEKLILKEFDPFDRGDFMSYEDVHYKSISQYCHKNIPNLHIINRDGTYHLGYKTELGGILGEGTWRFDIISKIHDEKHLKLLLEALKYEKPVEQDFSGFCSRCWAKSDDNCNDTCRLYKTIKIKSKIVMETEKLNITAVEYDRIILEELIPLLHSKFEESYPDTFVKCNTRDKNIYESANGCMYSWFMKISNQMYGGNSFSPKYTPKFNDELTNYDYSIIFDLINDLKDSSNWQSFIIENVNIGFK